MPESSDSGNQMGGDRDDHDLRGRRMMDELVNLEREGERPSAAKGEVGASGPLSLNTD